MSWLLQAVVLVLVGALLRRVLHMGGPRLNFYNGLTVLNREQARIYDLIVRDLEIDADILGIVLNEAIQERNAGNSELAWGLVQLAASEWGRLANAALMLLSQMSKYLPVAQVDSSMCSVRPDRFKSESMFDYVRVHENLARFVVHSKLRFQLHLRILRRAVEALTAEFQHLLAVGGTSETGPLAWWRRLDIYFHDLDLLSKETVLALRAFFPGLSEGQLKNFGVELHLPGFGSSEKSPGQARFFGPFRKSTPESGWDLLAKPRASGAEEEKKSRD